MKHGLFIIFILLGCFAIVGRMNYVDIQACVERGNNADYCQVKYGR